MPMPNRVLSLFRRLPRRSLGGGGSLALLLFFFTACAGLQSAGNEAIQPVVVPAGTQVPALALAFDLSYDPATDQVVPGYRILTVGITNGSLNVLQLEPMADRWFVQDRQGRRHAAVLSLRHADPDAWTGLAPRLKRLIEYPLMIGVGETRAVDLLFPDKVVLRDFQGVRFESIGLDKIIHIFARETTQ